jgi:drug/metabolite transporter (DMT)-like permease
MGLFWGILCGFAFGIGDLFTRLGVRNGTPFTGAVVNSTTIFVFFGALVLIGGMAAGSLWPASAWFLLMGIAATGPARILFYNSIRRIGVSRASVFLAITPLVSMLYAILFLGERPSWHLILGSFFVVGGILGVVTDRSGIKVAPRAALLALLPTLFMGLTLIFIRLGMKTLPDPNYGSFLSAFGALAFTLAVQKAIPREDRWEATGPARKNFLIAGLFYCLAFFTYHKALGVATVSFVGPLVYISPLVTILIARLFLQRLEKITWRLAVGAASVFIGVILVSISRG